MEITGGRYNMSYRVDLGKNTYSYFNKYTVFEWEISIKAYQITLKNEVSPWFETTKHKS
jgi:hypothetical protein